MPQLSRLKKSASKFLSLVFHRPKAKITRGTVIVAVTMPMILILALMMRLYPLMQSQPIPRAFDPWFQLKLVEYVAQHGYVAFFSWYDDTSWVPFGRQIAERAYLGVPFTGAFVYYLANALGIEVSITYVALVFPAIMGAITVLLSFFLGRETSNNTVGMLTALFMAVLPAYMQRSIAGFFDNESLGVFAIVLALWLFVRSLKRNSTLSAVGAGLAIAYLNASWGAADFLVSLFALYAFLMILFGRYSQRLLSTYTITIALGLFIGNLVPRNGFSDISSVSFMVPVGIGVLLVGYEIWIRMAGQRAAAMDAFGSYLRPILFGAITSAIGVVGYFVYTGNIGLQIATLESTPFLTIGGKFLTVVNPFFRMEQRIFASVAEHLPSPWSSFYSNLSVLVLFMPLGMYFLFKRRRDEDILLVLYGISSVYFTGSMIRLALILSVGAAVLGAVAVNGVLAPFARIVVQKSVFERRRFRVSSALTSEHALAAYLVVGLMLSMTVFTGVSFATSASNRPEFAYDSSHTDWQTAMTFIRTLPPSATIASWWDYGYWIGTAGGARTIVDNSTHNSTQIALMGYALMALNLTESLKTFKIWNATHVLVYWGHRVPGVGGDDGKWPWMVRIAEDRLGSSKIDDAIYLGDNPNTADVKEDEYTLDAFFRSTLYKLMLFEEPRSTQGTTLSSDRLAYDRYYIEKETDTRWVNNIPTTLHGAFKPVFVSYRYGLVKIYEIDYTMLYQYQNRTSAEWKTEKGSLHFAKADGQIGATERTFAKRSVVFGAGHYADIYMRANETHMYIGIEMENYDYANDAIGIQLSQIGRTDFVDIHAVNYNGQAHYDGYSVEGGAWKQDSTGINPSESGAGNKVVEYIIPLNSRDSQDLSMKPGMNYQIQFLYWRNTQSGLPTLMTNWYSFWVPVDLY